MTVRSVCVYFDMCVAYADIVNQLPHDVGELLDDMYLSRHDDPVFYESCMDELLTIFKDDGDIRSFAQDPRGHMYERMTSYFKALAHEYTTLKTSVRIFASRRLKKRIWRTVASSMSMSELLNRVKASLFAYSDFAETRDLLALFATCVTELHSLIAYDITRDICDVSNALFLVTAPVEYFESHDAMVQY